MDTQTIPVSSLQLDLLNPRFDKVQNSQSEAIAAMLDKEGRSILKLARSIVEHGFNPFELPIVMPSEDKGRYVVLEGNRRLVALRVLGNPLLAEGSIKPTYLKQLKKLAEGFAAKPVAEIGCGVVGNRDDADYWITLRHTGQNEGAGVVAWGGIESARYAERRGKKTPALQVLDFIKAKGDLDQEMSGRLGSGFPITNLERLIGDPVVRAKIGLELDGGVVKSAHSEAKILPVLTKIVGDIASKELKVGRIMNADQRTAYIEGLEKLLPGSPPAGADPSPLAADPGTAKAPEPKPKKKPPMPTPGRLRSTLVPSDFTLPIPHERLNTIRHELSRLNINEFPNASAVMFRVLVELGLDDFIKRNTLGVDSRAKLRDKITKVCDHLVSTGVFTEDQTKPFRLAANDGKLLISVETMHGYIHNTGAVPVGQHLIDLFDGLRPLLECVLA